MGNCLGSDAHSGGHGHSLILGSRKLAKMKQLGQGGFANVYLVQDKQTQERFALKVMNTSMSPDFQRFAQQELDILKNVAKPGSGLLWLIDHSVSDSGLYSFLLPLFSGTIQDLIDDQRKALHLPTNAKFITFRDERSILSLLLPSIKGLLKLHEIKLAHHDFKPANILIDRKSLTDSVLMDFGSVFDSEPPIGTPRERVELKDKVEQLCSCLFRSPELFDIHSNCLIDDRTDTWSIGCTMYAMAFGVTPFEYALNEGSLKLAVVGGRVDFPEPRSLPGGGDHTHYSEGFLNLIRSALNPDASLRPKTFQLLADIESFLGLSFFTD